MSTFERISGEHLLVEAIRRLRDSDEMGCNTRVLTTALTDSKLMSHDAVDILLKELIRNKSVIFLGTVTDESQPHQAENLSNRFFHRAVHSIKRDICTSYLAILQIKNQPNWRFSFGGGRFYLVEDGKLSHLDLIREKESLEIY